MTNKFQQMAARLNETKNLDTILPGTGNKYLGEGSHDVKIVAVDSSMFDRGSVDITFEDKDGKSHKEKAYIWDMNDADSFSLTIRRLIAALIPDKAALEAFLGELAAGNKEAFNLWTTMQCNITLKPGAGWTMHSDGAGMFVAKDTKTGDVVAGPHANAEDVKNEAGAKGLKRAFRRIFDTKATNVDANVAGLNARIAARKKAAGGSDGLTVGPAGTGGIV